MEETSGTVDDEVAEDEDDAAGDVGPNLSVPLLSDTKYATVAPTISIENNPNAIFLHVMAHYAKTTAIESANR